MEKPEFSMPCPFTGTPNSYREYEEGDRWFGETKRSGIVFAGESQADVERARNHSTATHEKVRALVSEHGTAAKALEAYRAHVQPLVEAERNAQQAHTDALVIFKKAEARAIVAQDHHEPAWTEEMTAAHQAVALASAAIAEAEEALNENDSMWERTVRTLETLSRRERRI